MEETTTIGYYFIEIILKNWKGNSEKMKKKMNIFAKIGFYRLNRYRFESSILGTLDGAKYLPK